MSSLSTGRLAGFCVSAGVAESWERARCGARRQSAARMKKLLRRNLPEKNRLHSIESDENMRNLSRGKWILRTDEMYRPNRSRQIKLFNSFLNMNFKAVAAILLPSLALL